MRLRIVPNARRSEVVGVHGDAVKIKVQAPAVEGRANEALLEFLADHLQCPLRDLEIVSGAKSRDKSVAVNGLGADEIRGRLLGGNSALPPE